MVKTVSFCDRPLLACDQRPRQFVVYEPDLVGYNTLARNWFVAHVNEFELTRYVPSMDWFAAFCERWLPLIFHLFLHEEYKMAGVKTDSTRKLLESIHCDGDSMPRYFIDLGREMARPMVHNDVVFIPWLPMDFDGNGALPGSGFQPDVCRTFLSIVKPEDMRPLVVERLLPAPLVAFVGSGVMSYHDVVASTRFQACCALRQLNNGATAYNPVILEGPRRFPRGLPLRMDKVANAEDDMWEIRDRFAPTPQRVVLPEETPAAEAVAMYRQLQQGFTTARDVVGLQVVFYLDELDGVNAWVRASLSRNEGSGSRPPIVDIKSLHLYGACYGVRFPSDEYHSRTPPDTGAPQRTVKGNAKGKKKKGNTSDSSVKAESEPPPPQSGTVMTDKK